MRTLYAFLLLLWGTASTFAQNITRVEYFIDTDPGFGAGTEISVGVGLTEVDLDFQVPLSGMTPGLHRLFIRAKDSGNKWSLVSHQLFYKDSFSALTLPDIVKVEYFIDTDPGAGNATDVPFTATVNVNDLDFSLPVSSLSDGPHQLFVRAKNALGNWGIVQIKTFSKQSNGIAIRNFPVNWCIGSGISVEFTSTGTFDAGNEFKIQISNYNGVFPADYSSQIIGSVSSTSAGGAIPVNIVNGSGVFAGDYKVRAIATTPGVPSATNVFSEEIPVTIAATCPCSVSDVSAVVSVTQEIACTGEASAKILAVGSGGVAPYQFRLDGGAWQSDPKFSALNIGTHTVESRDVNWCTTSDQVDVLFDSPLSIDGDLASAVLPDAVDFNFSGTDCRLIATVQGVGLTNGTTPFIASVTIEGEVKTYSGQPYLQRHFEFTPGGTTPTDATITIYLSKAEMQAFNAASSVKLPVESTDDKSKMRIWQWHGAAVDGAPDEIIDPVDANITWDAILEAWKVKFHVDGFSSFYVTAENAAPLPVTLVSFKAQKQENAVILDWQTTEETNSDHFEIQRGTDAKRWNSVGSVASKGEHHNLAAYSFTDHPYFATPSSSNIYYRLKMIDKDGSYAYSRIAIVVFEGLTGIGIFPNPAKRELSIVSDAGIIFYRIVNTTGRVMAEKAVAETKRATFKLPDIPAGIYLLQLTQEDGTIHTQQLVIAQ